MKKGLKGKVQNQKGFTLVEMLIVVAIIAILIAVSIPLVGSSLEKARDAADQANERAAKAVAVIKYLGVEDGTFESIATATDYWYDAVKGELVPYNAGGTGKPTGYGKCKGNDTNCYQDDDHTDQVIKVTINPNGTVTLVWE